MQRRDEGFRPIGIQLTYRYCIDTKTEVYGTTVRLLRCEGERNPNYVDVEPGGGGSLDSAHNSPGRQPEIIRRTVSTNHTITTVPLWGYHGNTNVTTLRQYLYYLYYIITYHLARVNYFMFLVVEVNKCIKVIEDVVFLQVRAWYSKYFNEKTRILLQYSNNNTILLPYYRHTFTILSQNYSILSPIYSILSPYFIHTITKLFHTITMTIVLPYYSILFPYCYHTITKLFHTDTKLFHTDTKLLPFYNILLQYYYHTIAILLPKSITKTGKKGQKNTQSS